MRASFAELAHVETRMGPLTLRRRREPTRQVDVYEVKLGDEFLMSSLFTVAEIELARLGLAALDRDGLHVVVGGLGLGCTARAVLDDDRVADLVVIDALEPVIDWHRAELLPDSAAIVGDDRCRLVLDDFFACARGERGFDPTQPGRRVDAVLVDIDHTPTHVLDASHTGLYTEEGLRQLARFLVDDGVFALWADTWPDPAFLDAARAVFADVRVEEVTFPNFLTGGSSANTVTVATNG